MKKLYFSCIKGFFLLVIALPAFGQEAPSFYFGVDLSYVNEMEDCGAVYHEEGNAKDPFELFQEHGATLVRARLWHNPDWTAYSTLSDVEKTLSRAKAQGMATLLDIHYSDNWADPSRQEIPAAWATLETDDDLASAVYQYTTDVLTYLHAVDLVPDFIQVGNETNSGMLTKGREMNWERNAKLFNAGITATRAFTAQTGESRPQIMLHIAQPENTGWWFTEAEAAGITDFDVIGVSFYPQWSTFSIGDMGTQVSHLRQRFGKDVMVVETGYPWTRESVAESASNILNQGVRGYNFTPEGQRQFMTDLTQSLISNGALGVVYWEPAWVSTDCTTRWGQGSHWENATFFDFTNQNELHDGIGYMSHAYRWPTTLVDGEIEADYGEALAEDSAGDSFEAMPALDLLSLYGRAEADWVFLAATVAGDLYEGRGNYLIYLDTTGDDQGADIDPGKRPILVADFFKPEYRLDISIVDRKETINGTYVLNAWVAGKWQEVTFSGAAAVRLGTDSTIEIQIPRSLLGNPQVLNVAMVSTNRTRIHTTADILGSDFMPQDWLEVVTIENFFSLPLP